MKDSKRFFFEIGGDTDTLTLYVKESETGLLSGDLLEMIFALRAYSVKVHYLELYIHYRPSDKYVSFNSYTEKLRFTNMLGESNDKLLYSVDLKREIRYIFSHYSSWSIEERDDKLDVMFIEWNKRDE